MAYMSQEMKKEIAPFVKGVLKKFGYKGTLKVNNYSTLAVSITEGPVSLEDIAGKELEDWQKDRGQYSVNHYHIDSRFAHNEPVRDFLNALKAAMNGVGSKESNYDRSDVMTDYFDVGWYVDIKFGNVWSGKAYKKIG